MTIDGEVDYEQVLASLRELFDTPVTQRNVRKTLTFGQTWLELQFRGDEVHVTGTRTFRDLDGPTPARSYRLAITYPLRLRTEALARTIVEDFHPQRFKDRLREDLEAARGD